MLAATSRTCVGPSDLPYGSVAVDALEPQLRLPIVLRYYYRLRSADIASVLGTSAVTIRWRLMIAHRRLERVLGDDASNPHPQSRTERRYADESIAAS
ncbi:MAG TPA: sigma factor-like helix-turn-helix DNA-binding protein [Candidatus Cybelea sp.]|nr:sigma factor-like helix-turn-helix DNA-binding protein [Candidatus Cybelea sp.]